MSDFITPDAVTTFKVQTRTQDIPISRRTGTPQDVTGQPLVFAGPIITAWASVMGFNVKFSDTEKEINNVLFRANIAFTPGDQSLVVRAATGIKDNSGVFDDDYEGFVTVQVTALLKA